MIVTMILIKITINSSIKNHKFGDLINSKILKKSLSIYQVIYISKYSATQYPVVTDVA